MEITYYVRRTCNPTATRPWQLLRRDGAGERVCDTFRFPAAAHAAAATMNGGAATLNPHAVQGCKVEVPALAPGQMDAALRLAQVIGTTSEVHAAAAAQRDAERSGEVIWRD